MVRALRPTLKWALKSTIILVYSLTEVVGTLTHADAPHQGNAPHSTSRSICHSVKFHAADYTQFRVSVFYGLRDSIDNRQYNTVCAPRLILEWALL
jgi:hypothetical protein